MSTDKLKPSSLSVPIWCYKVLNGQAIAPFCKLRRAALCISFNNAA